MKKQLIIASVICAGLGIFYFASRENEVRVGIRELDLPKVDTQSVTKVVYTGKEKFAIVKKGDRFELEVAEEANVRYLPASKEAIKELFAAIEGVNGGVFVTEQVAKHVDFHVNESGGQKVTLFAQDKPVWELIIGDYADEQGRYVRVPSQNAVFLAKARFWDITRSTMNDFRERQIVGLEASLVKAVRVEQGAKRIIAVKRDAQNAWQLDAKAMAIRPARKANQERLTEFVKTVVELRATAFVDAKEQLLKARKLLEQNDEHVVVQASDSEVIVMMAKDETEKKAYVQVKGSNDVFEISDYLYERLHTLLPQKNLVN